MFEDVRVHLLKYHQLAFMKVAFSKVPDDLDVPAMILQKHMRLFLNKGLNETHFDLVAQHFVQTLQSLGFRADLVDESVGVIAPLRSVFEKGALIKSEELKTNAPIAPVLLC
jgi:truncated hemoglobin YjbI